MNGACRKLRLDERAPYVPPERDNVVPPEPEFHVGDLVRSETGLEAILLEDHWFYFRALTLDSSKRSNRFLVLFKSLAEAYTVVP